MNYFTNPALAFAILPNSSLSGNFVGVVSGVKGKRGAVTTKFVTELFPVDINTAAFLVHCR